MQVICEDCGGDGGHSIMGSDNMDIDFIDCEYCGGSGKVERSGGDEVSTDSRARFEAHIKAWAREITQDEHEVSWTDNGSPYWAACGDSDLSPEWDAYQAAEANTLERAVDACRAERVDADDTQENVDYAYNNAIRDCIAAIRALKQ